MNSEATTPTATSQHQNSSFENILSLPAQEQYSGNIISAPVSPNKAKSSLPTSEAATIPPALPPRGNVLGAQLKTNNSVINQGIPNVCSSVPKSIQPIGTPTKQQAPAIQLSSPNDAS